MKHAILFNCPNCQTPLNASVPADGSTVAVEPGDWSLCAYCTAPLVLEGEELKPRVPSTVELREMLTDPDFVQASALLQLIHAKASEVRH